jgi:hypothetical protein
MTQVASYQVPAHPSGLDMRTQLNAIVLAILGDNAGPAAPAVTYPGMMWGDTTAQRLKRRTNANDGWVDIGPLDNFLGDVTNQINSAVANKVSKTGDTMTGALTVQADINLSGSVYAGNGNGQLKPDGNIWGTCYGSDYITNYLAGNYVKKQNYGWVQIYDGSLGVYRQSDPNGYGTEVNIGTMELWNYEAGAFIDFKQLQTQDYVWRVQMQKDGSNLSFSQAGGQTIQFIGDGNILCTGRGYVWDAINARATAWHAGWGNSGFVVTDSSNITKMNWSEAHVELSIDGIYKGQLISDDQGRIRGQWHYADQGFIAICIDGDNAFNRGIVTEPSDGRIKNILGASKVDALDAILHIPIIRYAFKEGEPEYNGGHVRECGFDAHQIQEVAPSMVFEVGEAKICNVYPNAGLAYCFRAIQQLFAILTDIRNELAELKAIIKGQAGESQS